MGAAFLRFERHTVAAACLEALRGQLMWHHCTSISWSRDSAPWPMVDAAVQATPTSNDAAVQATPGCGDATVQATPDCGDAEVQAGPSYRMLRLKLVLLVYKKNMALQLKEKQWPAVLPVWPEARQLQRRQTAPQTSSRLFWALKVKLQVFLSEKRVGLNSKVEQLKSQL